MMKIEFTSITDAKGEPTDIVSFKGQDLYGHPNPEGAMADLIRVMSLFMANWGHDAAKIIYRQDFHEYFNKAQAKPKTRYGVFINKDGVKWQHIVLKKNA